MIGGAQPDFSGSTFFVDSNAGSDGNSGLSFVKAWKTLGYAIAQNNINIAAQGMLTRRNTIFIVGSFNENLVAFPNQCDVIGLGTYIDQSMAGIIGVHAPVNTANNGTRFFNVKFDSVNGSAPIISMTGVSGGIQWIACAFSIVGTGTTSAISSTGAVDIAILSSFFTGPYVTSYITVNNGPAGSILIKDNIMTGSGGAGVVFASGALYGYADVINNTIRCNTFGIQDGVNLANIIRNNVFTSQPKGTNGNGGIVGQLARMQDNRLTASDVNNAIVPAEGTL
jgi:hypothetical protein